MKILSKIFIFSFIFTSLCTSAFAQMPDSARENLGVTISPKYPRAYETTTIKIQNYSTDLARAEITWSLNGVVVKKDIGEKSFTFFPGALGSVNRIDISALASDGRTITDSVIIIPADVDLLWQAESYVPPLYEGKALYGGEGRVTIVAIPEIIKRDGGKVDKKNLVYMWKKDNKNVSSQSGYGKDSLIVDSPIVPGPINVSVEVSTLDNSIVATKNISLFREDPKILFYEDNPLLGISYEKSILGKFTLPEKEMVLAAVPYFFQTDKKDMGLSYSWSLNGTPVVEKKSKITLRMDTNESGTALVGLEVKNLEKIFEFMSNSLYISFGGITQ